MLRRKIIPFIVRWRVYIVVILPLMLLFWLTCMALPATENDMRKSVCMLDGTATLCLSDGRHVADLQVHPVHQQGVWINRHWWWPSCDGRVLTLLAFPSSRFTRIQPDTALMRQRDSLSVALHRSTMVRKELEYYLRCHNVQDEGYNRIAAYSAWQKHQLDSLSSLNLAISKLGQRHLKFLYKCRFTVSWYDDKGQLHRRSCRLLRIPADSVSLPVIVHTDKAVIPWGCRAVKNVPWGVSRHKEVITVTLSPDDNRRKDHTILTRGDYDRGQKIGVAHAFAQPGTAVFTLHGRFVGLVDKEGSL
jgi:hypothetical protein